MRVLTLASLLLAVAACRPSTDWSVQTQTIRSFESVTADDGTTAESAVLEIDDSLIAALAPADDEDIATGGVFVQTSFEADGDIEVDSPYSLVVNGQYFGNRTVLTHSDLSSCLDDLDEICSVVVLKRFIAAEATTGTWSVTARIEGYGEQGDGVFAFVEDATTASE